MAVEAAVKGRKRTRKADRGRVDFRDLAESFAVLGNATRAQIIHTIGQAGPMHVGELCSRLSAESGREHALSAVSHHLSNMRNARFVRRDTLGKNGYYSLTAAGERLARAIMALNADA